jgi:hypothetical protein
MGGQRHATATLPPGKRPGIHYIGGWVGRKAGLDGCGKSRPHRDSIPDRPTRSESLYLLNYPGPHSSVMNIKINSPVCNSILYGMDILIYGVAADGDTW